MLKMEEMELRYHYSIIAKVMRHVREELKLQKRESFMAVHEYTAEGNPFAIAVRLCFWTSRWTRYTSWLSYASSYDHDGKTRLRADRIRRRA